MKLLAVLLLTALVGATQLRPDASQATPASSASPASPASSTARTLALHYVNLGIKEFDNHNWDAAEADFTKAINADPTLTDAYTWRGDTRDNKGDPAGALLDYAQAIKHDPKDQYAYATKCDTEREVAHYDAGIRDCKKAIALDPHDAYAYRMLGRLYVARGGNADYVNAVSSFTQSIKADNTVPITYAYRCQARELLENYSQALEDCDRALALDSSNHTAVFYEGVVLRDLGRFQDAVAEWNLYTKLPDQPGLTSALYNRGLNYLSLKNYTAAVADFKAYNQRTLQSPDGDGFYQLGVAYAAMGDTANAATNFRLALAQYTKDRNTSGIRDTEDQLNKLSSGTATPTPPATSPSSAPSPSPTSTTGTTAA